MIGSQMIGLFQRQTSQVDWRGPFSIIMIALSKNYRKPYTRHAETVTLVSCEFNRLVYGLGDETPLISKALMGKSFLSLTISSFLLDLAEHWSNIIDQLCMAGQMKYKCYAKTDKRNEPL